MMRLANPTNAPYRQADLVIHIRVDINYCMQYIAINDTNFFVAQLSSSFLYTEYNIQSLAILLPQVVVDGRGREAPAIHEPDHQCNRHSLQPTDASSDARQEVRLDGGILSRAG